MGAIEDSERKYSGHSVPLLPLRDIIIFPHMVVPLFVGREKSIAALEEAMRHEKDILLVSQKQAKTNEPTVKDIYAVGTLGTIVQLLKLPDGTVKVLVEGKKRARILRYQSQQKFFQVEIELVKEELSESAEMEALVRSVQSTFETYIKLNKHIPPEMLMTIQGIDDPSRLADTIVVHLSSIKLEDRQGILENTDPLNRLEKLYEMMQGEIEILQVEKKIRTRVKKQMEKTQKEYYLNEQMQAIQRELGDKDEFRSELQELEGKLKKKKGITKEAVEKGKRELKKLQMMSPMSAEATVVRNYLEWITELPWAESTEERYDVDEAERILEEDHYGLKKIKERIVEYLAVQALVKKIKGPILCFVGPPGTGKTSLGKSVARATGRKFIRLSLGGVRDEAEIRGHRRTYIGALPGKIIQSLRKVGAANPVFLLDEVDKMSSDFRGDPASALLEVLDPEQNYMFNDHYLDLDYDLSDVMFITTANLLSGIPLPLQDRMEIIELSSYTEFEKLNIAMRYLVPRQLKECGLEDVDIEISEGAVRTIINHYTREAGVRNLEREISSVCRKIARKVVKDGRDQKIVIGARDVPKYLGVPKFTVGKKEDEDRIGLVNGLAVTSTGGDLLPSEVSVIPGKGKLILTGRLGDVMQESAQAALSYVRSRAGLLGLEDGFYQEIDVHVHFPEGAVPKDGPSAGITAATCLVSALTRVPVRSDVAMTGEITLRGRVLPIGGLKEKILAAHRGRVRTVVMPKENRKDIHEIPSRVLKAMTLVLVDHMDDVLSVALAEQEMAQKFTKTSELIVYKEGRLVQSDMDSETEAPPMPSNDSPSPNQ
ncbi:MAG: endopeptidase La [Deltaproteobacteria bacterium]|nr:endopeptidase La [Deltaproteobacteria bacterium]